MGDNPFSPLRQLNSSRRQPARCRVNIPTLKNTKIPPVAPASEPQVEQIGYKEDIFYNEGGETLEQVAQRSCGGPIPGNMPGQAGWGFEKPDLVEDVPIYGRGKRRPGGDLISGFGFLMGEYREDGAILFSEMHSDRMKDNRHKSAAKEVPVRY
ncbi:hypothetical protein QYF61_021712 [Mycteria americana]|uniref:Uncharacterized protein n=1 Tax=Mycteria americana TaxID=33587 RepID=A0AAN7NPT3_MYCAM|nr:hypothetical protein QYF61_021709 [Mycteria americana]KAK4820207.1 hypothetical protein QYF61_021712 [Mycteria americana]